MSDPTPPAPDRLHPLLARQPRYCTTCGHLLTQPSSEDEPALCEHCLRPYDPADPTTFLPLPPPDPCRWWQTKEVPGLAWLGLYALGSAVIGRFLPAWSYGMGGGDGSTGSAFAGVFTGVAVAIYVMLPWLFACVYLLLVALEHHLRDELVIYLTAGAIVGVVCAAGYHPALLIVGAIVGALAGLVRQARMASHA